jgi:ABC-type transport system substrate-binding protein
MSRLTSTECKTAQNHFTGSNTGCWLNPEYDRLFHLASTTLDEGQRADTIIDLLKVQTADLPVFGDFYHTENFGVRKGLMGLTPRWPSQSGHTWNAHEWYWAS